MESTIVLSRTPVLITSEVPQVPGLESLASLVISVTHVFGKICSNAIIRGVFFLFCRTESESIVLTMSSR